jgi:predicted glycoside hydrolase/deacetylase ChbG (UPF0249 family)
MVFMEDSVRAADIALERGVDAGLHLNFTEEFSARSSLRAPRDAQGPLIRYLRRGRFAPAVFNPLLVTAFRDSFEAQVEEFHRLYGCKPDRVDGHHHMHLCANVMVQRLLPAGVLVRGSFSFEAHERSWLNRTYRRFTNAMLKRRHVVPDYLFSLVPLDTVHRLPRIFALGRKAFVEIETHPANDDEYRFLQSDVIPQQLRSASSSAR